MLGCTHYPFLESLILDITNNEIELINPATIVSQSVKESLGEKQLLNTENKQGGVDFYVSQNPELFEEVGKMLYTECQGAKLLTF